MINASQKKLICLLTAAVMLLSLFMGFQAAHAVTVSVGSSTFTSTQNITIGASSEGLSLRPTELSGSYASLSATQYVGELDGQPYSVNFTVKRDNFTSLTFTLISQQPVADRAYTDEELHVAEVENAVSLEKEGTEDLTGDYVLTYEPTQTGGTLSIRQGDTVVASTAVEEPIYKNEATLKIEFSGVDELFVRDSDDETMDEEIEVTSVVLTGIRLSEGEEESIYAQSFSANSSNRVSDTSTPVLRLDPAKLDLDAADVGSDGTLNDNIIAVLNTTMNLPVLFYDTLRSSITNRITVKYSAEPVTDWSQVEDEQTYTSSSATTGVNFNVRQPGYYAITRIQTSDGTNTVVYEMASGETESENSDLIYAGDLQLKLPLVYETVERTSLSAEDSVGFNETNYASHYTQISTTQKGGDKHTLTFFDPVLWTPENQFTEADIEAVKTAFASSGADLYSIVGVDADGYLIFENNLNMVSFTLQYRLNNASNTSSAYTDSTGDGLTFTARNAGPYQFKFTVTDRNGRKYVMKKPFLTVEEFFDNETPELNVTGFPDTIYLNQSWTVPSGTVTDDFDSSLSASYTVYHLYNYEVIDPDQDYDPTNFDDPNVRFTPVYVYEMDGDSFVYKKDENGDDLLDENGDPVRVIVYEYDTDEDGNQLYANTTVEVDGETYYVFDPEVLVDGEIRYLMDEDNNKIPAVKLDEEGNPIPAQYEVTGSVTPSTYAVYKVVYTAEDAAGNKVEEQTFYTYVVDAPPTPVLQNLSTTAIVFGCIAIACLVGIFVVLLIPTKDKKTR